MQPSFLLYCIIKSRYRAVYIVATWHKVHKKVSCIECSSYACRITELLAILLGSLFITFIFLCRSSRGERTIVGTAVHHRAREPTGGHHQPAQWRGVSLPTYKSFLISFLPWGLSHLNLCLGCAYAVTTSHPTSNSHTYNIPLHSCDSVMIKGGPLAVDYVAVFDPCVM